jgi:deoxyribodipyrimidine photo-lyase
MGTAIVWFRRDLRVHDLPALETARSGADRLVPVFCLDERLLAGRHASGTRTQFMLECLADLDAALKQRGSRLVICHGPPERELPALAREIGATAVHFSADVTPYARRRDQLVADAMGDGAQLHAHPGLYVADDPDEIRTQKGKPQTVFTPFYRAWLGDPRRELAPTPRELEALLPRGEGADAFRRQLCWRDFYAQLLLHHPDNAQLEFRERYRGAIDWSDSDEDFDAWRDGRTGFPLVDAGMRQLRRERWMHNRARLVVGSFLTKHLGIDWRRGERWFMRMLLDGDEANNNGNWQWIGRGRPAAGLPADLQPGASAAAQRSRRHLRAPLHARAC